MPFALQEYNMYPFAITSRDLQGRVSSQIGQKGALKKHLVI